MIKKQKKLFIIFLSLLALCFLFFSFAKVLALEVQYPPIHPPDNKGGETLTPNSDLPSYARYIFYIALFIGFFSVFVSLLIAGVAYLAGASFFNESILANAKDRVAGALSGLLVLILCYLIITTIDPRLGFFYVAPLPPANTQSQQTKQQPGVYFNNSTSCENTTDPKTQSLQDLGDSLRNKVQSVQIIDDQNSNNSYFSVLYGDINFRGSCLYLESNNNRCQQVSGSDISAGSASIYQYDFSPQGDGVYFYRKSFFDDKGGYFYVPNSKINGVYEAYLGSLRFQNVPENEKDCIKYDANGQCTQRSIPTLAGENISSIKINGDYVVLLSYAAPGEDCSQSLSYSCQVFPTSDDINKIGPQQIKWEQIRNFGGVIPNCVNIFPVIAK